MTVDARSPLPGGVVGHWGNLHQSSVVTEKCPCWVKTTNTIRTAVAASSRSAVSQPVESAFEQLEASLYFRLRSGKTEMYTDGRGCLRAVVWTAGILIAIRSGLADRVILLSSEGDQHIVNTSAAVGHSGLLNQLISRPCRGGDDIIPLPHVGSAELGPIAGFINSVPLHKVHLCINRCLC